MFVRLAKAVSILVVLIEAEEMFVVIALVRVELMDVNAGVNRLLAVTLATIIVQYLMFE